MRWQDIAKVAAVVLAAVTGGQVASDALAPAAPAPTVVVAAPNGSTSWCRPPLQTPSQPSQME